MAEGATGQRGRDRAVVIAAAVAVATILIVWLVIAIGWLGNKNHDVVGSNSVSGSYPIGKFVPGTKLCAAGELIPRGTEAIQIAVAPSYKAGAVERAIDLSVSGGTGPIHGSARFAPDQSSVRVPISPAVERTIVGSRVCLNSTAGRFEVLGESNPPAGWVIVGGHRFDKVTISLAYLRAEPVSAASQVGAVLKRASMYRPGWVGPWTFWLLAIAAIVAMLAALAALVLRSDRQWSDRRWLLLIAFVVLVNGVTWSIVTPPLQAPDESSHLAYVETLAHRGLPSATTPANSEDMSLLSGRTVHGVALNPTTKLPWTPLQEQTWVRLERAARAHPEADGITSAGQYTPLYYGLAVIPYELTPGGVIAKEWGLRLFSILLTIGTALLAFAAARVIAPDTPWLAPFVGLFAAFEPMLLHLGAAAHLDPFVTLLTSLFIYLVARAFRDGVTSRNALAISTTLALATVAKPISIALVPAAIFVAAILLWRKRPQARETIQLLAAGALPFLLLVGVAYSVFNGTSGAVNATSAASAAPLNITGLLTFSWEWFLPRLSFMASWYGDTSWGNPPPFFTVIIPGFFAKFNYLDTGFPFIVYRWIAALGGTAAIACLIGAVKYWQQRSRWLPITIFSALAVAGTLAFLLAYGYFMAVRSNAALIQGRYFLPLITIVALFFAAACFSVSKRWAPVLAVSLITALALLNLSGYAISLARFYL